MAHVLIALSSQQAPQGVKQRVEAVLEGMQSPGVRHPVTAHSCDGVALGVLGPRGEGAISSPGCRVRGALAGSEGRLDVALGGLTIEVTTRSVRVESDSVGSRTLWFCRHGDWHLLSTSQRALISWLGDVQLTEAAKGWFMVSGSAGPGLSWDSRIRSLPPASTLLVRADSTAQAVSTKEVRFERSTESPSHLRERMQAALRAVGDELPHGPGVGLSLSGGLDSRVVLALSRPGLAPGCVAWGAPGALEDERTDAAVAKRLAEASGASFRFLPIRPIGLSEALDNYVAASEGRLDHVTGYLDGMDLWRTLAVEEKVTVLLRGDEAFGWLPVLTSADARRSVGAPELRDFANASQLLQRGLGEVVLPRLPDRLARRRAETCATWRDRLYHQFRVPSVLAALTTAKSGYLEIVNPLLDDRLLNVARGLSDAARTGKRLFREVAQRLPGTTGIPFASFDGRMPLSSSELATIAVSELETREAALLLPPKLREWLLGVARTRTIAPQPPPQVRARRFALLRGAARHLPVPTLMRRVLRNTIARETLPVGTLLLRSVLLCRTLRLLERDARCLKMP